MPTVGAVGVTGCAFTVTEVGAEMQVGFAVLLTKIVWEVPAETPAKVVEA